KPVISEMEWRPRPESNRCIRICNPLRHHSATRPLARLLLQVRDLRKTRRRQSRIFPVIIAERMTLQGELSAGSRYRGGRPMEIIEQDQWSAEPGLWRGMWEGGAYGAPVTVLFNSTAIAGFGPRLHAHPYPETFIIRAGRALFTIGGTQIEAVAGQILVCP